jgi:hypothetical protein
MSPTFLEIWTNNAWRDYFTRHEYRILHRREYYKFRSVCRMVFWIPLTYLTLAMFLSLGA